MSPRILISGLPGSGKSTLAASVIEAARARGWRVAGVHRALVRKYRSRGDLVEMKRGALERLRDHILDG